MADTQQQTPTPEVVKLSQVQANSANPRSISGAQFQRLVDSLLVLPKMLELRPIVVDATMTALGGNMRYRALCAIADMSYDAIGNRLAQLPDFVKKTKPEQEALLNRWLVWRDAPTAVILRADKLTDAEAREFIIKDNVGFGEWDYDALANEWDEAELKDWGLDVWQPDETGDDHDTERITETERLSSLDFTGMYYEPKRKPDLELSECIDTSKFDAKVAVIESSNLTSEQKAVMLMFAYRFIKINFEAVANYYEFNASDEEKAVIERLRMVLVDGSVDGFIEDDLIRVREEVMASDDSWMTENVSGYDYDRG